MPDLPLNIPSYPMLRFMTRHGRVLVAVVAVVLLVIGVIMALATGAGMAGLVCIVLGGVVFVVGRIMVELIELITDMLLPK